jgi:hydroxymethylbilane synthase
VPIAAHARIERRAENKEAAREVLVLDGLVGSVKGDRIIKDHLEGRPEDGESMGITLAEMLLAKGADKILSEVYGSSIE